MIGHSSIVNLDLKISSREIADSLAVHNESSVGAQTAVVGDRDFHRTLSSSLSFLLFDISSPLLFIHTSICSVSY